MQRGCSKCSNSVWLDSALSVCEIGIPPGQSQVPHRDEDKLTEVSMVLAAACVMLELKSMKYLSSSMVAVLFEEPFPLLST